MLDGIFCRVPLDTDADGRAGATVSRVNVLLTLPKPAFPVASVTPAILRVAVIELLFTQPVLFRFTVATAKFSNR